MGIIEEGQAVMKEFKGAPALDAGLLAAAQAVEHYEIARYGTLKTWAAELGLSQAVGLLETTLGEEKKTDETLTKLAQSEVIDTRRRPDAKPEERSRVSPRVIEGASLPAYYIGYGRGVGQAAYVVHDK
jgi:ferritin-like metal-binding protein YciE